MNDTIYFLILVAASVCVVIASIYRAWAKRRHPSKEKRVGKTILSTTTRKYTQDMDNDDDDIITNPGFSSLKSNIFHKDRHED